MIVAFDYEGQPYRFEHPEGDHIGRQQAGARSFYELDLLEAIRSSLRARRRGYERLGGYALDVGAHVGNHAVYFASVLGMGTLAIEPNPAVFPLLVCNLAQRSHRSSHAWALPFAAGTRSAWSRVVVPPFATHNSGMAHTRAADEPVNDDDALVRVHALDDLAWWGIGSTAVDLIKIDVEGAEKAVIFGAQKLLRNRPIVTCEAHTEERRDAVDALLTPFGLRRDPRVFGKTPTYLWSAS